MSFRGSFVTEYIYCRSCFEAAKKVLTTDNSKYFCGFTIGSWTKDEPILPVIAGKIGDTAMGGEISTFDDDFKSKPEESLCHPLKLVFITECDGTEERIIVPLNPAP